MIKVFLVLDSHEIISALFSHCTTLGTDQPELPTSSSTTTTTTNTTTTPTTTTAITTTAITSSSCWI